MTQYISKSDLVAEIERLRKNQRLDDRHGQGVLDGLHAIEKFINTLEVKEVDLEKEYEEFVVNDSILNVFIQNDIMGMKVAKHFFELGLKAQKGEEV